jgi:hypothetical protein
VKIGLFRLKEVDSIQYFNQVKVRFFKELNTGITLFRVDSGLVDSKQKSANSYLEYLHLSTFLSSLECSSYSNGTNLNYSVYDMVISSDFLCFAVFKSYYCGGAHPDEENYGVNFNLNTQKNILSSDYLIPEKAASFHNRVYTYLAKMNPSEFDENNSQHDSDCAYYEKELWTTDCKFVFRKDGILLLPSFSHFRAPCLDPGWSVIPYSELKDLIKPEYFGKLTRLKN